MCDRVESIRSRPPADRGRSVPDLGCWCTQWPHNRPIHTTSGTKRMRFSGVSISWNCFCSAKKKIIIDWSKQIDLLWISRSHAKLRAWRGYEPWEKVYFNWANIPPNVGGGNYGRKKKVSAIVWPKSVYTKRREAVIVPKQPRSRRRDFTDDEEAGTAARYPFFFPRSASPPLQRPRPSRRP